MCCINEAGPLKGHLTQYRPSRLPFNCLVAAEEFATQENKLCTDAAQNAGAFPASCHSHHEEVTDTTQDACSEAAALAMPEQEGRAARLKTCLSSEPCRV